MTALQTTSAEQADPGSVSSDVLETVQIAKQNDRFRQTFGADFTVPGQVVYTAAVNSEGPAFVAACMVAVMQFSDFTEDVDPYGDHSFGAVDVMDKKVWFKIDLYDEHYKYGSEEPSNTTKTRRVLTILFPSDY